MTIRSAATVVSIVLYSENVKFSDIISIRWRGSLLYTTLELSRRLLHRAVCLLEVRSLVVTSLQT